MADPIAYNGRRPVDPKLAVLAKRLNDVVWHTPLSTEEKAKLDLAQRQLKFRRISLLPNSQTWMVRFYIGGDQRNLGMTRDFAAAARFADMARAYLWKYRTRGIGEPVDTDLNISSQRANYDLDNEVEAVALLREIEAHLLKLKAIVTPEERQRILAERKEGTRCNRTLAGSFDVMATHWNTQIAGMQGKLDATGAKLDAALSKLDAAGVKLDNLQAAFDHLLEVARKNSCAPADPVVESAK